MKNRVAAILLVFFSLGAQAMYLDGHYKMKLKVGNKIFHDEMELKGVQGPISLRFYGGKIQGSVTVPGAFTSPLRGEAECSLWGGYCHLAFTIVAKEQGQTYKVRYVASLIFENYMKVYHQNEDPLLAGSAYYENGQLLGTFEAIRDYK